MKGKRGIRQRLKGRKRIEKLNEVLRLLKEKKSRKKRRGKRGATGGLKKLYWGENTEKKVEICENEEKKKKQFARIAGERSEWEHEHIWRTQ